MSECQISVSLEEAQRRARAAYTQGLADEQRRLSGELADLVDKFRETAKWSAGTGPAAWLSASYLLADALAERVR